MMFLDGGGLFYLDVHLPQNYTLNKSDHLRGREGGREGLGPPPEAAE